MVHGDIKGVRTTALPYRFSLTVSQANILVDGEHNARIADFGVSVATQDTGLPTLAGSRGTAAYKAPETVDNGDDETATYLPTCASDVYATVVLIWEVRSFCARGSKSDRRSVSYTPGSRHTKARRTYSSF
jgi:serine/threonine protein kinase